MSLLKDPQFMQHLDLVLEDPIDTKHLLLDLIDDGWDIDKQIFELPHKTQVSYIRDIVSQIDDLEITN